VTYLVEVPVEGGGRLVVEAGPSLLPSDLELASSRPVRPAGPDGRGER
jgi:hypothetical protein